MTRKDYNEAVKRVMEKESVKEAIKDGVEQGFIMGFIFHCFASLIGDELFNGEGNEKV